MNSGISVGGFCLLILALIALSLAIVPFILMVAWNAVVPTIFGGPVIDFWQSLAMYVVFSIIGGAFRTVVSAPRS